MDRTALLDDAQWDLIEPLLPPQRSGRGRPMRAHRQVVEGVIYRYRCGIAWRDLPAAFGPWQTVWKRHRRFSGDGTWDKVLAALLTHADAAGEIDWSVSVDSTINRAHQHGTNLPRGENATGQKIPVPVRGLSTRSVRRVSIRSRGRSPASSVPHRGLHRITRICRFRQVSDPVRS